MTRPSKLLNLLTFDNQIRNLLANGRPMSNRLPTEGVQMSLFPCPVDYLIGVDEVGRGSLAGPVVAGAVTIKPILHPTLMEQLSRLDDSKKISPRTRERLADAIGDNMICATGSAEVDEINSMGITRATELAMLRAVQAVKHRLGQSAESICVIVDGRKPIEQLQLRQVAVVGADSKSACVAAASVIAKVHRDALMAELGAKHPQYNWSVNKGYPAPAHLKALLLNGPSPLHRTAFIPRHASPDFQLAI